MPRSKLWQFDSLAAITVTRQSTNVIKLADVSSKIGSGKPLFVRVEVDQAFTAAGAATLDIQVQDGASAGAVNNTIAEKLAIPKATLVLGYRRWFQLPPTTQQFLAIQYTVATGPMTAGTVSADLSVEGPTNETF